MHLERLLPRINDGASSSENMHAYQEYENTIKSDDSQEYEKQSRKLFKALQRLGIEQFRVDLLMDRYVSNLTLKEIQNKRHYLDIKAVNRIIKETLQTMSSSGVLAAKSLLRQFS